MATVHTSRTSTEWRKQYRGVLMQLGRVLYDDDWNESERISAEEQRRTRLDAIGPHGTSDEGFRVQGPAIVSGGEIEFTLEAGTLYVGGLRLTLDAPETFRAQTQWLDQPASERAAPTGERIDLAYVEVLHGISVGAVEDGELLEVALGGADTAVRMRDHRRVRLLPDVGVADCAAALAKLADVLASAGLGTLHASSEALTDVSLTIGLAPGDQTDDLCRPSVAAGYLGAENQTIRVELVDGSHFTWGYDNAASLYRATISADGATVTLVTEPKDEASWPTAGQVVEILPWSAVLPNGEKTAAPSGHLSRVKTSYSPDTGTFGLDAAVPSGFGQEWKNRSDAAALGDEYVFVRVWDRGSDTSSPPAIPFNAGTAVALAHTGLEVTFSGTHFRPGDHWVVAARPDSPAQVVPWSLDEGREPHGVRRFYAPLALIRWTVDGSGSVSGEVLHDCRGSFFPLTRLTSCCTYTVGDGVHSRGVYSRIQDAIDRLPPSGGEICVLPGLYRESIRIEGKRGVRLHGCGDRTKLVPPERSTEPVIRVAGSRDVTLADFAVETATGHAIVVDALVEGGKGVNTDVRLENLEVRTHRGAGLLATEVFELLVRECRFGPTGSGSDVEEIGDDPGWPAIYAEGRDLRIEENSVLFETRALRFGRLGGIQIGGGSRRVTIARNHVRGGLAHAVTLGSIRWVPSRVIERWPILRLPAAELRTPWWGWIRWDEDCFNIDPLPPRPDPGDDPDVPVSGGPLEDIAIYDNRLEHAGASGISVARFFPPGGERPQTIAIDDLRIERNVIRDCGRVEVGGRTDTVTVLSALGGITLASVRDLVVRANLIERNGKRPGVAICGVFVGAGVGLVIGENRIVDNGIAPSGTAARRPGHRGGIVAFVGSPNAVTMVRDNIVVTPDGPSLVLMGIGAMHVHGNHLRSRGSVAVVSPLASRIPRLRRAALAERADSPDDGLVGYASAFGVRFGAVGAGVFVHNEGHARDGIPSWRGAVSFGALARAPMMRLASEIGTAAPAPVTEPAVEITEVHDIIGNHASGLTPSAALDAMAAISRIPIGGAVTFGDNVVEHEVGSTRWLNSVVYLTTKDDVVVSSNSIRTILPRGTAAHASTFVKGTSVRVTANRFQEGPGVAMHSAVTVGTMNDTSGNQSTTCILATGRADLLVDGPNRALYGGACEKARDFSVALAKAWFED